MFFFLIIQHGILSLNCAALMWARDSESLSLPRINVAKDTYQILWYLS